MGEIAFTELQFGIESAHGTPVAADTRILGAPFSLDPDRQPQYPRDLLGVRAESNRSVIYQHLVQNTLMFGAEQPPYFQILPFLFSCGLQGGVTPAEQTGSQEDYLWDFSPNMGASNTPDSATLEFGDDDQAYECEYTMFDRYAISGDIAQDGVGGPVNIEAGFFARQWTKASLTGAIAIPTVETMSAKVASFYLDTTWAGLGGTQKTGLLRGYNVEILPGIYPTFDGDGNKYFSHEGESYIAFTASFVFEGNSDAGAIFDAFNAKTWQFVRLQIEGSQIGTGDNHSLIMDFAGQWSNVVPLQAQDRGDNLHGAVMQGMYDGTGAQILGLTATTNVSAI